VRTSEVLASTIKVERLQTREVTNSQYIDDLAERMLAGDTFPPVVIFSNGKDAWLPDGIHRLDAAIKAKKKIAVQWRKGTRDEAIEYACGANGSHGMRRTNSDKRRAVELALKTFPDRSSRAIAELCVVSRELVDEMRKPAQVSQPSASGGRTATSNSEKRTGRDGKNYPAAQRPAASKAESNGEPVADDPEPLDPNSLEAVQADLKEAERKIRDASMFLRRVFRMEGKDIKRPFCGRYSAMSTIDQLQHVARNLSNDMPVGGTASKPKLFCEEKAESVGK
jgi:hypothetical protein